MIVTFDREEFRQWLTSKEPDEVVGRAEETTACPGVSWLKSRGEPVHSIGYQVDRVGLLYRPRPGSCSIQLAGPYGLYDVYVPSWLEEFVFAVDELDGTFLTEDCGITAKQALEVLDSLEVAA